VPRKPGDLQSPGGIGILSVKIVTDAADNRLINADVNGSLNILRLGMGRDFDVGSRVFNPVKLNEFRDVRLAGPADRGSVADPVRSHEHTNVSEERLTA